MSVDTDILWQQVDAHFDECDRIEAQNALLTIEEQTMLRPAVAPVTELLDERVKDALTELAENIEAVLPEAVPQDVYEELVRIVGVCGKQIGLAVAGFTEQAAEDLMLPVDMLRENIDVLRSYIEGE